MALPLSVLDLSPIPSGFDAGDALRNTLDLARHAEALGYRRYWLAEHPNAGGLACPAPEILIGQVAAVTNPIALSLIEAAQVPIAAPSANRFTQLSPTTAQHVREGLGERVDYILDGGPCTVGIESTVLSLAGPAPLLLRPGGISRTRIEEVIGAVEQQREALEAAHPSPGMHPRHYSPQTKLLLVRDGQVPREGAGAYLQLQHPPATSVREVITMPLEAEAYAAQLYRTLHDLDVRSYDWIAVDVPPDNPEWEAVCDRLQRAATPQS